MNVLLILLCVYSIHVCACMLACFLVPLLKFNCLSRSLFLVLSRSPVLSADRVEQMTKTYNDIEVVTHLLAEVGSH